MKLLQYNTNYTHLYYFHLGAKLLDCIALNNSILLNYTLKQIVIEAWYAWIRVNQPFVCSYLPSTPTRILCFGQVLTLLPSIYETMHLLRCLIYQIIINFNL